MDDYAKDGGPREAWFFLSFYHETLRTRIKTNVNKLAIWNHVAFKSHIQALRSYFNLSCEYELHILSNTKVSVAKDHGKNYMKVRPPWVRHLLRDCRSTRWFQIMGIAKRGGHYFKAIYLNLSELNIKFLIKHSRSVVGKLTPCIMCVQYRGGISWVPWGDILSTVGGYHDKCGGISW